MGTPRFTIVLVTYNARDRVEELLEAIDHFTLEPREVIVVDNGSTDGTLDVLACPGIRVVENQENRKGAAATNQALRLVTTEYVVYLCASHALVAAPGWEQPLLTFMDANRDVAMAGDAWHPRVALQGPRYAPGWRPEDHEAEVRHVQGGAWIARRRVFDEVGYFDEANYPHDFTDVEYSYRLLSYGKRIASCAAVSAGSPSSPLERPEGVTVYHHPPKVVRDEVRDACGLPPLPEIEQRVFAYDGSDLLWTDVQIKEVAGRDVDLIDRQGSRLTLRVDEAAEVYDALERLSRAGLAVWTEEEESKVKLDLACGQACEEGYEGVDIAPCPGVKHVVNLFSFPWPFADESVSEITCKQFVEHIPMLFWTPGHSDWKAALTPYQVDERSLELWLKFFDEVYRILAPGGSVKVVSPQAHNNRAFQDPTHRRFLVPESYLYLDAEWRRRNGITHAAYGISCDFKLSDGFIKHSFDDADRVDLYPAEANQARVRHEWNFAGDLFAFLKKAPRPVAPVPTTAEVATAKA